MQGFAYLKFVITASRVVSLLWSTAVYQGSSLSSEDLSSFLSSSIRVLAPSVSRGADRVAALGVNECVSPGDHSSPACTVAPGSDTVHEDDVVSVPAEATSIMNECVIPGGQSSPVCTMVPEVDSLPAEAVMPAINTEVPQVVVSSSDAERVSGVCVDESRVDVSLGPSLGSGCDRQ
ncbi:hypothetical protein V6N11_046666 [Hibiscus sabdariffa]|uniref:Secreted protein n=1 Tax=Hibiscus sabdariffa TaxID=183260 RepID=A0ABR2P3I5_9ROSI